MNNFVHIKWPKFNFDYGFMLEVKTLEELVKYFQVGRKYLNEYGLSDYLKNRDGQGHPSSTIGCLLDSLERIEYFKENPCSPIEIFAKFNEELFQSMGKTLNEAGAIYINVNGGYMTLPEDAVIVKRLKSDTYENPSKQIRVSKWGDGSHWYAYVGGESVERFGRNKWDTEQEAKYAAQKYIEEGLTNTVK